MPRVLTNTTDHQHSAGIVAAFQSQTRLGWQALLQGYISIKWAQAVADTSTGGSFETSNGIQKRWTRQLIKHLWTYSKAIWSHRNGTRKTRSLFSPPFSASYYSTTNPRRSSKTTSRGSRKKPLVSRNSTPFPVSCTHQTHISARSLNHTHTNQQVKQRLKIA